MANALYTKFKQALLEANINMLTNPILVALVDTGTYTVDLDTHEFASSLGASVVGIPVVLANKSIVDGVFDADDVIFPSTSGDTVEALVLYHFVANEESSHLIAYIDTAAGLPVTPSGGDIVIAWDSGPNKIFSLA